MSPLWLYFPVLIFPYISADSCYTGNVSADSIGGAVLLSLGEGGDLKRTDF